MANPRIVYDPGSGSRNLNFPEDLSDLRGPLRTRRAIINDTEGGVVMVHMQHTRHEFELVLERVPRNDAFEEECAIFWSHASSGKAFAVALDSADMVSQSVRVASAALATRLLVDASGPFQVNGKYLVESLVEGGYALELFKVTAKDVASAPSIDSDRPLAWGYAVGDRVRSVHYHPKCSVDQDQDPVTIAQGSSTFDFHLKVRTHYDLVTA